MIIFGVSSSVRNGAEIDGKCYHCDQPSLSSFRIFRYFHLFWLPVVPLGSSDGLTCGHCLNTICNSVLRPEAKQHIKNVNKDTTRPLWHFIGTIAVIALITIGVVDSKNLEAQALQAAAQPQVGDVWIVNVEHTIPDAGYPYKFSAARVVEVTAQGAELKLSDWSFSLWSGAQQEAKEKVASNDETYFINEITFSAEELVQMQATEDLRLVQI